MIKYAKNGKEFQENSKDYVINMLGNKRKLHKKNGCYFSHVFAKYCDFKTYDEAKNSGISHTDCELCFGKRK